MRSVFALYIGFLYSFGLIVYPQWYLPDSSSYVRYSLAFAFLILTLGAFLLARYLVNQPGAMESKRSCRIYRDYRYELIVGLFCLITHLPFMKLPILPLGDGHMHAGLPALALAKLNSLCAAKVGISFRVLFFLCSGAVLLLLLKWRECLLQFLSSTRGFTLILLSGVVYVMVLSRFPILERFGKLEHFFRYPVLGKSLFFFSYATFGIHEWVGRVMQIAFLFAGAFYFSRLLELLSNREIARAGYLIFLMFPPFWDLAHQNYLTAGVLFFSVASMYYLVRYLRQGRPSDIYIAMAIMATGITYKRLIIALIPISYAMAITCSILKRKLSAREMKRLFLGSLFPLGLAIPDLFLFSHLRRLYRYYPQGASLQYFVLPQRLVESLHLLPSAIGWPLVFVTIIGLFLALKYRRVILIYFLVWFIGYWFLISASDGYCFIRHSLIGYIPIAGFIAFCAGMIWRKLPWKIPIIPCFLYLYLSFLCLYIGTGESISMGRRNKIFLPYDKLFQFIKHEQLYNHRIYAPMKCEPSHFYMGKYGLPDTEFLFRKKWDRGRYEKFKDFLSGEKFCYLVIPQGPRVEGIMEEYIDRTLLSELLNDRATYAKLHKTFQYGENTLWLFKITERG